MNRLYKEIAESGFIACMMSILMCFMTHDIRYLGILGAYVLVSCMILTNDCCNRPDDCSDHEHNITV